MSRNSTPVRQINSCSPSGRTSQRWTTDRTTRHFKGTSRPWIVRIRGEVVPRGTMLECSIKAPPRLISMRVASWMAVIRPAVRPPTTHRIWRRLSLLTVFSLVSSQKQNAPPGRTPHGRASEYLVRRQVCWEWARAYAGSIRPSSERCSSIFCCGRGVKKSTTRCVTSCPSRMTP